MPVVSRTDFNCHVFKSVINIAKKIVTREVGRYFPFVVAPLSLSCKGFIDKIVFENNIYIW